MFTKVTYLAPHVSITQKWMSAHPTANRTKSKREKYTQNRDIVQHDVSDKTDKYLHWASLNSSIFFLPIQTEVTKLLLYMWSIEH